MVSFMLVSKNKSTREAYFHEFITKHAISPFDITRIEKEGDNKSPTQSIGIEIVKNLQKRLFFKPIRSITKLIVIEDAHALTTEAQNALLKVLEEPPENTFIILGTDTKEMMLPTILSRCQVIEFEEEQKKLSEKTIEELTNFIKILPELSINERLKQAELLAKDKEKALVWLENLILVLRENLLEIYSSSESSQQAHIITSLQTLKSFQSLHTLLKTTNSNPRFSIEHTLLNI